MEPFLQARKKWVKSPRTSPLRHQVNDSVVLTGNDIRWTHVSPETNRSQPFKTGSLDSKQNEQTEQLQRFFTEIFPFLAPRGLYTCWEVGFLHDPFSKHFWSMILPFLFRWDIWIYVIAACGLFPGTTRSISCLGSADSTRSAGGGGANTQIFYRRYPTFRHFWMDGSGDLHPLFHGKDLESSSWNNHFLGEAFKDFLEFWPRLPREMMKFDERAYFSDGLVHPPTSIRMNIPFVLVLQMKITYKNDWNMFV